EGARGDDRHDPAAGVLGVLEAAVIGGLCHRTQERDAAPGHYRLGQFPGRPYRQQCQGIWLMMASSKLGVFTIVFGVAYAAIYVICTELNLPLLTYHPLIGEVNFLCTPDRRGPAMDWYGWEVTPPVGGGAPPWNASTLPGAGVQQGI